MQIQTKPVWRTPAEIVTLGFQRSRVLMMNEAHNYFKRSIRARRIGQGILPVAHACGVRHLAMEALNPAYTDICNERRQASLDGYGYLFQPEMRALIQAALDLGWTLISYEADDRNWTAPGQVDTTDLVQRQTAMLSMAFTNWREEQQALNLIAALKTLPAEAKLLVWCGNGHNTKVAVQEWTPMGYQFARLSGMDPFVLDQTRSICFHPNQADSFAELIAPFADDLQRLGGTAGFFREEGPERLNFPTADAFLMSIDNELE